MESQTTVNEFVLHTPSSASGKAAELLDGIWSRHDGQVGPMVRAMAGSPSVLSGYLDLSRAMKRYCWTVDRPRSTPSPSTSCAHLGTPTGRSSMSSISSP